MERPFTPANLRIWGNTKLAQYEGQYKLLRVTTGPNQQELDATVANRNGHGDFPQYYGATLKYWPKHPIAQIIAYGGRAALQIQIDGMGFATEELLQGSRSPALFEIQGSSFRLLHFQIEGTREDTRLVVFLQSEKSEIERDSGAIFLREIAKTLSVRRIRVLIRPDAWAVDTVYPMFYRFVMDFGPTNITKPQPPSPRSFFRQGELICESLLDGGIKCSRLVIDLEHYKYP